MDQAETSDVFEKLAVSAVEMAKTQNVNLDYSNESIERLEAMLGSMHKEVEKMHPTEEQFVDMANVFGAYIGNAFIRNLRKGSWEREPSQNAWGIKIDNDFIFFPAKVYRRLKKGTEENTVHMYQEEYNKYSENPISLNVFV